MSFTDPAKPTRCRLLPPHSRIDPSEKSLRDRERYAAEKRNISVKQLWEELREVILHDNLIDAILDDRKGS